MNDSPTEKLRATLAARRGIVVPGAPNALVARVVADFGFEAVYLTGAGLTNMFVGIPDLGFMDLTQVVQHTMAIRAAVEIPIIVDADTGFGNAPQRSPRRRHAGAGRRKRDPVRRSTLAEALRPLRRQGTRAPGGNGEQGSCRLGRPTGGHAHHRSYGCTRIGRIPGGDRSRRPLRRGRRRRDVCGSAGEPGRSPAHPAGARRAPGA